MYCISNQLKNKSFVLNVLYSYCLCILRINDQIVNFTKAVVCSIYITRLRAFISVKFKFSKESQYIIRNMTATLIAI